MPLCTLHLVQLVSGASVQGFLHSLVSSLAGGVQLVTASQVRQPLIRATRLDSVLLNATSWDLLLLFSGAASASLPDKAADTVLSHYLLYAGIPGKIIDNYADISSKLNKQSRPKLLVLQDSSGQPSQKAADGSAPTLASSTQNLELSQSLLDFARELKDGYNGPVSMLNLLQFRSDPGAAESYHKYGQGFATVAGKRGANAKVVGLVVKPKDAQIADSRGNMQRAESDWWNECSLVHYPSIDHFADMAADPDYQSVNSQYRLKALKDTALICTTEIDLAPYRGGNSKL